MHIQNFISIGQLKLWEFPICVDNLLPKLFFTWEEGIVTKPQVYLQ